MQIIDHDMKDIELNEDVWFPAGKGLTTTLLCFNRKPIHNSVLRIVNVSVKTFKTYLSIKNGQVSNLFLIVTYS